MFTPSKYMLGLGLLALLPQTIINPAVDRTGIVYWFDLGITEQVQIITGIIIMILTAVVAVVIFRSVWIKKGYEGLDEKLEGKEVALLLAHVFAFICLIVFEYVTTFNPHMRDKFPDYVSWICASVFAGPEVYILVNFIKSLKKDKLEITE